MPVWQRKKVQEVLWSINGAALNTGKCKTRSRALHGCLLARLCENPPPSAAIPSYVLLE